ncbi:MAG: universal stress protein, partial [Actinomycetota bacterium]|nr:universal stress protein [Actinomycetota bacterium]
MIEYPTKVLLATDGTPDSEAATTLAVALASREGAELHVVHVGYAAFSTTGTTVGGGSLPGQPAGYAEQQARMLLEEGAERIREAGGDVCGSHLRMGQPAQEVVGLSEEMGADLLVIGSGRPRAV